MLGQGAVVCVGFFQAEDGIRDVERSRGLGDVYKRQRFQRILNMNLLCVRKRFVMVG